MNHDKTKHISESSTILYGVPKVGYGTYDGCTPFPICLKACANYLGEDVGYDEVMVSSGAAFRLTWDTTCWNGGNVDVTFAFDDPIKVYETGVNALGRKFNFLGRDRADKIKKEDFAKFIKEQIDSGFPCIALGIIGPPEACIITGYRDYGETLLGWNFFQDNPEFGGSVKIDESGYFIANTWWENPETIAVMSIGEKEEQKLSRKEIIGNAILVLEGRKKDEYAKGILAYDAWEKSIADDKAFPENAILSILVERLMCQGDAMDCLADGRRSAFKFLQSVAADYAEHQELLSSAADHFMIVAKNMCEMADILGGWARDEQQMRNLAKPETRQKIAKLIDESKVADSKALEALKTFQKLM